MILDKIVEDKKIRLVEHKKAVSFLPLSHAYVLGGQVLTPLSYGACVYSLCGCRFLHPGYSDIAYCESSLHISL